MKKIGFILLGIICILFSSRWTLTAQAGAGTLLSLEDGESVSYTHLTLPTIA